MVRKIAAWSSRRSHCRQAGDQVGLWYSALMPNMPDKHSPYTTSATRACSVGAKATSSGPLRSDTPKATTWNTDDPQEADEEGGAEAAVPALRLRAPNRPGLAPHFPSTHRRWKRRQ